MSKGAGGSKLLRVKVTQLHSQIYRGKLGDAGPLPIFDVNARPIRDHIWEDWIGGGNGDGIGGGAYPWMPAEIWIEHTLEPEEKPLFMLHELHEYNRIRAGLDYNRAHNSASAVEQEARDHPERLSRLWAAELAIVKQRG